MANEVSQDRCQKPTYPVLLKCKLFIHHFILLITGNVGIRCSPKNTMGYRQVVKPQHFDCCMREFKSHYPCYTEHGNVIRQIPNGNFFIKERELCANIFAKKSVATIVQIIWQTFQVKTIARNVSSMKGK